MTRTGRRVALGCAVLAAGTSIVFAFRAARELVVEWGAIGRLDSKDQGARDWASRKLVEQASVRALPALLRAKLREQPAVNEFDIDEICSRRGAAAVPHLAPLLKEPALREEVLR